MFVKDILKSGRPFPSIEIVPPLKGVSKSELLDSVRPFMEFNPPFINVTCHRDEIEFVANPDGTYTRNVVRRRVSETAVCEAVMSEFKVEVVPHLICGGATAEDIDAQLQDFRFLGINNVMALRGDSMVGEKRFVPTPGGYAYADALVSAVRSFEGRGGAGFCIGVGGYPEKHFEAPNLDSDIRNLKRKVDAGADFIITQMFFDNSVFYRFRDKCREAGIDVPIVPGLKPLSTVRQLGLLPEAFSLDIPKELEARMRSSAPDCYQVGLEWCVAQCSDLLAHGVPAVHFYTMGRPDNVVEILRRCF